MANFDIIYKIATDLSGLQKGVDDTAKATTEIDKKMTGLQGSVSSLGKSLIGAFGAVAIGNAIKGLVTDVISLGSQLADVSAKTGISLKGLQLLKVAAEQNGVSLDQVATAANKLGINIAGGGKDVLTAVSRLGLSLDDLKKGDPEQNLFKIAKAMDGIENPADRAKIAMSLFGKAGVELLPVLNGHFSEAAAAAERLGIVMGDDVLAAADKFDDQMVVVRASMMKLTAEALTPMLPGLLRGAELFVKFASGAIQFGRAIVDFVIGALLKAQEVFLGFFTIVADITDHVPLLGKALGATGFSFDSMKAKTKEASDQYRAFAEATAKAARGTDDHTSAAKKALPAIQDWGKAEETAAKAAKVAAENLERLKGVEQDLYLSGYKLLLQDRKKYWDDVHAAADRTGKAIVDNWKRQQDLVSQPLDKVPGAGDDLMEQATAKWLKDLKAAAPSFKTGLTEIFKSVPQTIASAFTGGGGLAGAAQALGSQFGAFIGESIGKSIASLGKLGGPIGAALGSLAGPLIGFLAGKLNQGGGTAAQKAAQDLLTQAQKLRNAFLEASGSLGDLQSRAAAAGVTLAKVLDAKTPEAYRKAVEELNAAFEFQDHAMQVLDDTVEKYGFTIEQLGPKFAAQRLHEQAGVLLQDYSVLTAAGVAHVDVIKKMAPALNEYVSASLKAGTAIPEQMRPILQSLADQGLLVDENGEKLTDLSKLTFAETLDAKFQTLIKSISDLVAAIERGLNPALNNIPHPDAPWADWPEPPGVPDYGGPGGGGGAGEGPSYGWHGGGVSSSGISYLAEGAGVGPFIPRGLDTVPAMLSVGEGVLSRDGMRALGALNRGAAPGRVVSMEAFTAAQRQTNASLEALRRDLATTIPTMVGIAARHGDQTRGRKR